MIYNGVQASRIPEFPDYCITIEGEVFNTRSGRRMVLSPTLLGELTVGMMKDGKQYRRSVKLLVAEAFVPGRNNVRNTPIQKDGDRNNLRANNILWRPRWFALKYSEQFLGNLPDWYYSGPIRELRSDEEYYSIIDAAKINGLLCKDVLFSLLNETPVYPTGEIFVYI